MSREGGPPIPPDRGVTLQHFEVNMPKIKMSNTARGCDDGFTVRTYQVDQEYEVGESLANSFIGSGSAVAVEAKSSPAAKGRKNKSRKPKENKDELGTGDGSDNATSDGTGSEEAPPTPSVRKRRRRTTD